MLALVHASSRYDVRELLDEAREAFLPRRIAPRDFDIVEIPFPERGEPQPDRARREPPRPQRGHRAAAVP